MLGKSSWPWGVLVLPKLQVNSQKLGVQAPQGCARFAEIASELTKTLSSGATEFRVWIGNYNVKVWNLPRTNSTKYETQNILVKFQQNEHTPEFGVWIGNCNAKVWKSTEDKLHKIWNSKYFSQISAKRAHPRFYT